MKKINKTNDRDFYGTANIGEKGQVVIPVEARNKLKLKKGDRLLVFGTHGDMLALLKLSQVEKIATELSGKLEVMKRFIKNK